MPGVCETGVCWGSLRLLQSTHRTNIFPSSTHRTKSRELAQHLWIATGGGHGLRCRCLVSSLSLGPVLKKNWGVFLAKRSRKLDGCWRFGVKTNETSKKVVNIGELPIPPKKSQTTSNTSIPIEKNLTFFLGWKWKVSKGRGSNMGKLFRLQTLAIEGEGKPDMKRIGLWKSVWECILNFNNIHISIPKWLLVDKHTCRSFINSLHGFLSFSFYQVSRANQASFDLLVLILEFQAKVCWAIWLVLMRSYFLPKDLKTTKTKPIPFIAFFP